ncbi:MAG: DUF3179 domain-containing protein [Crocinitomicaceae bacterium]
MKSLLFITFLLHSVFGLIAQKNPRDLDLKWKTDTNNTTIPLNEFTALMYADGIPPIDDPDFYDLENAKKEYFAFEPVIAVEIDGKAKAYPLSVLMFHEIVNDSLGGTGITVTYCPLCNSALVFNRDLVYKGKSYHLDFGVSGMLRKSDMVMYDRQTESWWQQFMGEALVGALMGAQLDIIPAPVISLDEFAALYPNGRVLAKVLDDKGEAEFSYGHNPYVGYDDIAHEKPRLFFDEVDDRLPAMSRVVDVIVGQKHKIYPLKVVSKEKVINDSFEQRPISIFYTEKVVSVLDSADIKKSKTIGAVNVFWAEVDGRVLTFKKKKDDFIDHQTKSVWNMKGECIKGELKGKELTTLPHGTHFAFAMFAFYPDALIYKD